MAGSDQIIPVFKPSYTRAEIEAVTEVMGSGWIGLGPKTAEFESCFTQYVGAGHAVALNSGTAALHLSLLALGIGPGDEVLVPTITFVSTAHAVGYCGATPVFCDVEPDTLNLNPADAETRITERTKAIMPVHYGGHPCDMDTIRTLADQHGLLVIEDAAHACGSLYKGRHVGALGSDATCFSFHAVKNLATADGGMVTTDRLEIAQSLLRLRWCGIDKSTWQRAGETDVKRQYSQYTWYYEIHDLGYKYHMNDIAAAIGLVQLGRLDAMNQRRREIASAYTERLSRLDWVTCPVEKEYAHSGQHNYVIKTKHRDALNLYLRKHGISTGVHYIPIHLQPYYRQRSQVILPAAEKVWKDLLTLPVYPNMTDQQVQTVIGQILEFGDGIS